MKMERDPISAAIALLMSVRVDDPIVAEDFACLVRNGRERCGLSLQELADACWCSKSYLWEVEQGRSTNISARLVWLMSKALAVDPVQALESAAASYDRLGALVPKEPGHE